MIEKMKKVVILASAEGKQRLLESLRNAGVMHVTDMVRKSPLSSDYEEKRGEYQHILQILEERGDKKRKEKLLSSSDFDKVHVSLKNAVERESELKDSIILLQNERERIAPFGDFNPEELKALAADGISLSLYTIGKKDEEKLRSDESLSYIPIAYNGKGRAVALVNSEMPAEIAAQRFDLPEKNLSEIDAELLSEKEELKELGEKIRLGAEYIPSYPHAFPFRRISGKATRNMRPTPICGL